MSRIVLFTFGSLGDLHPYLAIGRELRARGHAVRIASLPAYRGRVEAEGLDFHPVRPDIDPNDKDELRRAMHKRTGPEYIIRDIAFGHLRETFEDARVAVGDADLIVTHPMAFAGLLLARAAGRPWASVALAPVSLFSAIDPPVYPAMPFRDAFASFPPGIQRAFMRLVDAQTRRWQRSYREIESELGLPPGPNPVLAGQHSPHLVLALFSPELAAPQPDWPARTRVTGFPFYAHHGGLAPELLAFLDGGEPPIVFTLGSAAVGSAGDFFAQSLEAARRLRAPALFLVGSDPANRPAPALPDGMLAVPYAPHAAVFPRASVIVHQGGIGTTGEAMRAGRPMLVVPYSHDQPDHARRLRRIGVARSVAREKYEVRTATRELEHLLADGAYSERAATVGARVRNEDGVQAAVDALQALSKEKP